MDVSIGVGSLRQGLARAAGVAGGKGGTLPILSSVLLDAAQTPEGGRLTLRAYDLEIEVVTEHACEVRRPGSVAVSAKALGDIAKALPSGAVKLSMGKGSRLEVDSGTASFRLAVLPAEDFPASPTLPAGVSWVPVNLGELVPALDRIRYAMSSDETRYNLNGMLWEPAEDGLALVCTDGHRMAAAELEGASGYGLREDGSIVGRKALEELHKLLTEESTPGDLAFAGGSVFYRRPGLRYAARLVDGAFPAWRQVLPGAAPKSRLVGVARGALRDGLRRVLLMAGDTASAVTLELSADRLRLSARTPDLGEATDEVACTYAGEARELRVNGRYLAELVNAETVDALTLHVGEDELSPVMVVPDGASGVQHVVMPMRG